jgi:hypothetical protein
MVNINRLSTERRAQVIGSLVEGNSIRATVRMTGAAKNTVTKLLVDLGAECAAYQDRTLRALPCTTLQVDEMWGFCYAKQRNVPEEHKGTFGYGDVWTWIAVCADTKLVPSWLVGERNLGDCWTFLEDLKGRLSGRIQLSTDGHATYRGTVGLVFGGGDMIGRSSSSTTRPPISGQAATAHPPAPARPRRSALATRTHRRSAPATSSARTSRSVWGCAGSRA